MATGRLEATEAQQHKTQARGSTGSTTLTSSTATTPHSKQLCIHTDKGRQIERQTVRFQSVDTRKQNSHLLWTHRPTPALLPLSAPPTPAQHHHSLLPSQNLTGVYLVISAAVPPSGGPALSPPASCFWRPEVGFHAQQRVSETRRFHVWRCGWDRRRAVVVQPCAGKLTAFWPLNCSHAHNFSNQFVKE